MISALLVILKFLGILILVVLSLTLILLLLVLFVPVRYKLTVHRKIEEDVPIVAQVKVTWLAHILNVAFSYPHEAYIRVRLFCFTVFRTGKPAKTDSDKKKRRDKERKSDKSTDEAETEIVKETEKETAKETVITPEENDPIGAETKRDQTHSERKSFLSKFVEFFRKLFEALRNIRYTISGIYDKIKQVVNNIRYYIKIIKSETFNRAWGVCSKQVFSLLKSIGPRKISGSLLIGTGDPAGTGQVMAAYGILYPLIGDHLAITPDFERQIVEGDLLIKGKITVFRALKTAWIVYFNRDLRRLIKLFKREAA